MAEIKINQLNVNKPVEIIDLKQEAEQGNLEAMTAFKTLRGGMHATCCWCTLTSTLS